MKQTILLLLLPFLATVAFSQISKNQWLLGGTGSFEHKNSSLAQYHDFKNTIIALNPDAGYFLLNSLAVGLRPGYSYSVQKGPTTDSSVYSNRTTILSLSPFVRYYFLPQIRKVNILAEASYGWTWTVYKYSEFNEPKYQSHAYKFSAGPAWFITPSAALELTLNYTHDNNLVYTNDYHINVGFQLHFGKGRKEANTRGSSLK